MVKSSEIKEFLGEKSNKLSHDINNSNIMVKVYLKFMEAIGNSTVRGETHISQVSYDLNNEFY